MLVPYLVTNAGLFDHTVPELPPDDVFHTSHPAPAVPHVDEYVSHNDIVADITFFPANAAVENDRYDRAFVTPASGVPNRNSDAPDCPVDTFDWTYVSKYAAVDVDRYVGSTTTGNTRSGAANHPASGVTVTSNAPGFFPATTLNATAPDATGPP